MASAVGAIFMALDSGRVMLNLRSETVTYPNYWGFVGGKIEAKETPLECLKREITEELGSSVPSFDDIIPFDVFTSKGSKFQYFSFLIFVQTEFIPELNSESSGYAWVKVGNWPQPLHPGAKSTILNKNLLHDFTSIWNTKTTGTIFHNNLPF